MFTCDYCGKASQPHEKPKKIVAKTRKKEYPNGKIGWETVKIWLACPACVVKCIKDGTFVEASNEQADQLV